MYWIHLLLWFYVTGVEMVQKQDFKTCKQSGFCRRNRALASKASRLGAQHVSPYRLDPSTVKLEHGSLEGIVYKTINTTTSDIALPLHISFLKSGAVRVTLDEQRRRDLDIALPAGKEHLINKARFNEAEKYAIAGGLDVDESITTIKSHDDGFNIQYGPGKTYEMGLSFKPLKIVFSRDGETEIILNDRGLMNLEHWRSKEEVPEKDSNEPAEMAELEKFSDEEDERAGMWEEDFNGKHDSKPRGPEAVGLDITFVGYANVYGLPEHTGPLSLRETTDSGSDTYDDPYRLYNTDVFQYEPDSPMALYGSIPFMQAHKKGSDAGVFWLNAAETWVDIAKGASNPLSFSASEKSTQTHWVSESGLLDVFVFLGPDSQTLYNTHSELIGKPMLPPLFSIGHHQCRWNYESEDDVLDVTANFDKHDIPYDVIWLDIEYTQAKKYFTWNKAYFPDPARMMDKLEETKRKLVAIIDPHVKKDPDFPLYQEALAGNHCIKDGNGGVYEGQCWPGPSVWPDFTKPETSKWWSEWYDVSKFEGSKDNLHIWNDMNEPAIFTGPDISMHRDSIHDKGWEHRDLHNAYGSMMVKSTYEGMKARNRDEPKRPFILSRSFWAGTQRFGAIWSGDNMGTWEHLESATATLINNGLAGMTFSGADVGGFFDDPPKDMLTRWYQAGAFYPFFRAHAHIDTKRREPWLIGQPYTGMIREAILLRYSLLPTWYTAFYETATSGMPLMRPHFLVFPNDEAGFQVQNQYFIGSSGLLHHPVVKENAPSIELYLADDEPYYDYHQLKLYQGRGRKTIQTPIEYNPVFIHGGHIITRRDRHRRSSELTRHDPITLVVALNNAGTAKGTLYQDDGETFRNENGEYVLREFSFNNTVLTTKNLHPEPEKAKAYEASTTGVKVEKILIVGYKGKASQAEIREDGRTTTAEVEFIRDIGSGMSLLSIRNPAVLVARDWTITLK
ncbi:protein of unknown function [Taphrina deformans PYCC 5710]|uniref:Glucosidase II subunit alpha n=1 Tax=Taphrina deformans (strain PYCC 5710 / ATCC 11124 / CBS 356.35 / IMI 108563 / JCM 9778 / NBRC 8474) TaxID=1097556 RepID=R4XD45_TAPDE|nr:protein of unknown function [Taphrina deformans PYCC 5710]|eukprot:CCG83801.1 protein of unknown function [Taphrina deformans PYCC 5710]